MSQEALFDVDRPLCKCHQEPMGWNKRGNLTAGGYWFCRIRNRETKARWREANREKVRGSSGRYYKANREKILQTAVRFREANPEKIRERGKRYRESNPEKILESQRRRQKANPERYREYARRWREANPEKVRELARRKSARYHKAHPEKRRETKLLVKYGLTLDGYAKLLEKQGGVCGICESVPNGKPLDVDHDHATNRVRGLLCSKCNTGLGKFGDTEEGLQKAVRYLAQSGETANEHLHGP